MHSYRTDVLRDYLEGWLSYSTSSITLRKLRALSTLRGLRGAPEVPPLCRETQSLGQQMLKHGYFDERIARKTILPFSFHIDWDMIVIVVTVFHLSLNQIEFHLVQNLKESYHHDHIPLNMKENIVFSVHMRVNTGGAL